MDDDGHWIDVVLEVLCYLSRLPFSEQNQLGQSANTDPPFNLVGRAAWADQRQSV